MKRHRLVASLAFVAMLALVTLAVLRSAISTASPLRGGTPVDQTQLSSTVKAGIVKAARQNGIDPENVVELGGSGSGSHRHALLASTDASGATLVSFLTGFGMSDFVAGSRYVNADRAMVVTDSVEGPSTDARIVGVVGIATRAVEAVTLDLTNGTKLTLTVSHAPEMPYKAFSYVSSDASTFPVQVTAYDARGNVLAEHAVDVTPLCTAAQPDCLR
jgi:hypothetical protein